MWVVKMWVYTLLEFCAAVTFADKKNKWTKEFMANGVQYVVYSQIKVERLAAALSSLLWLYCYRGRALS